jgi:hypothetical protein
MSAEGSHRACLRIYFHAKVGFANPDVYEHLKAAMRSPANRRLVRRRAPHPALRATFSLREKRARPRCLLNPVARRLGCAELRNAYLRGQAASPPLKELWESF